MSQKCWSLSRGAGFLMSPDPITDLDAVHSSLSSEASSQLQETAMLLPGLIRSGAVRSVLADLPVFDVSAIHDVADFRVVERVFQIYAHFANAYVWCDEQNPADHIPASIAVPLVQVAAIVERPPILPYASTSLCNFERIDPAGELVAENLRCVQKLVDIPDETWFHVIHVEIEAHAAKILSACQLATSAAVDNDSAGMEQALARIPTAFQEMINTFRKMVRGCSPEVYYHTLRPYLFGFDDVVYEGVAQYDGQPQSFRGESGAQSTVIPMIQSFLGLQHERGGLTDHLEIMKTYMPRPHRELLENIESGLIREFVVDRDAGHLKDAYNGCLRSLVEFRSLHLKMAGAFVAKRVKNPKGTGGTEFMHWLAKLRDETEQQYV